MTNQTKTRVGWRYNVVFGVGSIALGACAPDTGPGSVSQVVFIVLGSFALAQAGSLKQLADGGMDLPISEITRVTRFAPFVAAVVLAFVFVITDVWIVKLVYVGLISWNMFFFGMLSQRRRAQLDH